MQSHPAPWPSYVIPLAIMAVVMALRWRRMRTARRLRLETLWVLPAIYVAVVAALLVEHPPTAEGWGWYAMALLAGGAIGWQRGRMMRIIVDPETHQLSQQGSPLALLLLVVLVLLRQLLRFEFSTAGRVALLATGVGLSLGVGLVVASRIEMALRARRLLAEARAAA